MTLGNDQHYRKKSKVVIKAPNALIKQPIKKTATKYDQNLIFYEPIKRIWSRNIRNGDVETKTTETT